MDHKLNDCGVLGQKFVQHGFELVLGELDCQVDGVVGVKQLETDYQFASFVVVFVEPVALNLPLDVVGRQQVHDVKQSDVLMQVRAIFNIINHIIS